VDREIHGLTLRLRKSTGDNGHYAPIEKTSRSFKEALQKSVKTPFSE
jgi:hypothetical protein